MKDHNHEVGQDHRAAWPHDDDRKSFAEDLQREQGHAHLEREVWFSQTKQTQTKRTCRSNCRVKTDENAPGIRFNAKHRPDCWCVDGERI